MRAAAVSTTSTGAHLFGTTTTATSSVSGSGCSRLSNFLWYISLARCRGQRPNDEHSCGAPGSFPTVGAGRFLYLFGLAKTKLVKPILIASALALVAACQTPPPPAPPPVAAPAPPPPEAYVPPPAAPTAGMERRHARRAARHERRHARREVRHERRAHRRGQATPASTSAPPPAASPSAPPPPPASTSAPPPR